MKPLALHRSVPHSVSTCLTGNYYRLFGQSLQRTVALLVRIAGFEPATDPSEEPVLPDYTISCRAADYAQRQATGMYRYLLR